MAMTKTLNAKVAKTQRSQRKFIVWTALFGQECGMGKAQRAHQFAGSAKAMVTFIHSFAPFASLRTLR
jgi:hypothetical protein